MVTVVAFSYSNVWFNTTNLHVRKSHCEYTLKRQ